MNNYQKLAGRTAKRENMSFDITHAALGLSGEAGEFADAVKKFIVYGKDLDRENCVEELGDILWYVALACNVLRVDMDDVCTRNILKLQMRYPDKYTDEMAIKRMDKK